MVWEGPGAEPGADGGLSLAVGLILAFKWYSLAEKKACAGTRGGRGHAQGRMRRSRSSVICGSICGLRSSERIPNAA